MILLLLFKNICWKKKKKIGNFFLEKSIEFGLYFFSALLLTLFTVFTVKRFTYQVNMNPFIVRLIQRTAMTRYNKKFFSSFTFCCFVIGVNTIRYKIKCLIWEKKPINNSLYYYLWSTASHRLNKYHIPHSPLTMSHVWHPMHCLQFSPNLPTSHPKHIHKFTLKYNPTIVCCYPNEEKYCI